MSLSANTAELQTVLEMVNELPGPTVPQLQEKSITPGAESKEVTPDSGYDGLSKVTVDGDSNLIPDNIKSGVSIFGVSGTVSEGTSVQTKTGTFRFSSSGSASVSCGFEPDFVAISCGTSGMGGSGGSGYTYHAAVDFTFAGKSSRLASIGEGTSNGYDLLYFLFTQSSSGFSVMGKYFDYDYSGGDISTSKSWSYIAVKYTA